VRREAGRGVVAPAAHRLLAPPEDVLQHDDGVVDEHAHAEREPAQAHDVQRHARSVQQRARACHGDRDRQRDGHGVAGVPQEQEEHQERQQPAQQQCLHHVGDGVGDEARLRDGHVHRQRRVLGRELAQHLVHALRHPHRVRAGLLEDQHAHGLAPVQPRERVPLSEPVVDAGHVPDPQPARARAGGGAAPRLQRHSADLRHRLELAQRAQRVAVAAAQHRSARRAGVGRVQRPGHGIDVDAVALQQPGVHLDADLPLETARDDGLRDAVHLLEATLQHRLRQLPEQPEVRGTGQPQGENRLGGRIGAQHRRPARAVG
jgi:hypothetical protein